MYGCDCLKRLHFDNKFISNQNVDSISNISHLDAFVNYRNRHLNSHFKFCFAQLMGKASYVSGFKQSRS